MRNKWKIAFLFMFIIGAFVVNKFISDQNKEVGLQFANYKNIQYSSHARCRMDCRNIDQSEIQEILREGKLNESKTRNSSKGTSYAIEGWSHDEQHVRVVCSPHDNVLVIVTVIDLENNWNCDCK